MKFLTVSIIGFSLGGLSALAQNSACPSGDPNFCFSPSSPTTPVPMSGTGDPPPGFLDHLPQRPIEENRVWLGWTEAETYPDPLIDEPGYCAASTGRIRDRFEKALLTGDINKVIATYHWAGKTDSSATPIIDRLSQIGVNGQWERTFVSVWTGVEDTPRKAPTFWRWNDGVSYTYFSMRKFNDCWFLEFSGNPGESHHVNVGKWGSEPAEKSEEETTHTPEHINEEEGAQDPLPDIINF